MDGLAAARARSATTWRDIYFVLLTAQGTVETAVDAMKEGAYDYLTKPVDPQRLQILLEKIVERARRAARTRRCAASCARRAASAA